MAKARMLHRKISVSAQVNRLSLEAQVLFTWAIAHADDDGRMSGDPDVVNALVVPMKRWSDEKIIKLLDEIKSQKLINYWKVAESWFIEFPNWKEYQYIQKDRYIPSKLPSFTQTVNNLDTNRIHRITKKESQYNASKYKEKEVKTSEIKNSSTYNEAKQFLPKNAAEAAAKDAWLKLEPNNNRAFFTTYLEASKNGLPPSYFYQFVSEIRQSQTNSPGAVFNTKVNDFLNRK